MLRSRHSRRKLGHRDRIHACTIKSGTEFARTKRRRKRRLGLDRVDREDLEDLARRLGLPRRKIYLSSVVTAANPGRTSETD